MSPHTQRLRIVVTGLIAQHPALGGVTWDYLQYPLGLARLGHDVYYLEDSGEWPYTLAPDPGGHGYAAYDCSANVDHLATVMKRFGLDGRWCYRFPIEPRWFGMSARKRHEILRSADLLLNVSGTLHRPSDYRTVGRLAYLDSDPVFTQIKLALPRGQAKFQRRVAAHDVHFSFGERLAPDPPTAPFSWLPTRQPVVLGEWVTTAEPRSVYTTVMSWSSYKPLTWQRLSYGQKDVELERFVSLPGMVPGLMLEIALNDSAHVQWETEGLAAPDQLARSGWHLVDALETCADLDRYRSYLQGSKGEWSVAKNGYVRGAPGWFSCRSACYLAAGRPVVVQDTGFADVLPTGRGLLRFSNPEEAATALAEVEARYPLHATAALDIAREYFDSDRVLSDLVERAMAAGPVRATEAQA